MTSGCLAAKMNVTLLEGRQITERAGKVGKILVEILIHQQAQESEKGTKSGVCGLENRELIPEAN